MKARPFMMQIVVMPPPVYFWKLAPIQETIASLQLGEIRTRICHFDTEFDRAHQKPSAAYIRVCTSCPNLPITSRWCTCTTSKEHPLDWYGDDQQHVEWRNKTLVLLIRQLVDQLGKRVTTIAYNTH
eukprot:6029701-Pyramimonas_sp.AAC.1